jgi:hypothetical protein
MTSHSRGLVKGLQLKANSIGGVMVSVLASSAVDRGFEPRSCKTKCESALRRKNKDWLARNQDNVSE